MGYTIGEQVILEGVNLELNAGELMVVQGSNGSGKTTLLRMVAGLIRPTEGDITWCGEAIHDVSERLHQIAYVGHKNALTMSLSVLDNIVFWSKIYNNEELVAAAIHFFDLERFADMPVCALSAGWQRKVALSRLILTPAKLWLLDEPTSHLDEESVSLLDSLLTTRKEQGGVILVSLHGEVKSDDIKILNINKLN